MSVLHKSLMSEKLIGKTLDGRYVLEEVLGTGATGSVFRATQTAVDRVVAIKTLHPFLQDREDFQDRFEIEAKAIARLNHPNLITLYDFGYDAEIDAFYMAVEFIKGTLLADMMTEPIPYDDVMSIAYQIAEALEHAHTEGILHRDLKPENIMIQRSPGSGRPLVKVLDFGLARLYETEQGAGEGHTGRYKQITQAGQVYGTPAYMSPEQCRAREELTPATDIYALGTMLFELLEGRLPFSSQSTAELILMQLTEDPPEMTRLDVPPDLKKLVHAMMQKDPAQRPQSARVVQLALLAHVRLDASQEMRIVPSESGEFRAFTSGDHAVVPSLELSDHELRATQPGRRVLIGMALSALFVGFLGAMLVVSWDEDRLRPATGEAEIGSVDDEDPAVADSREQHDSVAQAEVEEERDAPESPPSAPEDAPNEESPREKQQPSSAQKERPPAKREATGAGGRAKTLKLTY